MSFSSASFNESSGQIKVILICISNSVLVTSLGWRKVTCISGPTENRKLSREMLFPLEENKGGNMGYGRLPKQTSADSASGWV